MYECLAVGLGGFFGAICRYLLSGMVHKYAGASFPFGTLVVNVLGSFLLGALMYLSLDRALLSSNTRLVCCVGFMGALTTFSTCSYETVGLMRDREILLALLNVGANVVLTLGAVWLGHTIMRVGGM